MNTIEQTSELKLVFKSYDGDGPNSTCITFICPVIEVVLNIHEGISEIVVN